MIYTSYFEKLESLPNNIVPISISDKTPDWYKGLKYKKLTPRFGFIERLKANKDKKYYTKIFKEHVLSKLNVNNVILDFSKMSYSYNIGEKEICLLCNEKPSEFCHRHLVAKWFNDNGILCEEWR